MCPSHPSLKLYPLLLIPTNLTKLGKGVVQQSGKEFRSGDGGQDRGRPKFGINWYWRRWGDSLASLVAVRCDSRRRGFDRLLLDSRKGGACVGLDSGLVAGSSGDFRPRFDFSR